MSTKYEIGGHLIDANGGRHPVIATGNGRLCPVYIHWADSGGVWLSVTTLSMLRYEPPAKPEPTRFEVGQVWELGGETMRPRIISDNGDCAVCINRDNSGREYSCTYSFYEAGRRGWKLREGA